MTNGLKQMRDWQRDADLGAGNAGWLELLYENWRSTPAELSEQWAKRFAALVPPGQDTAAPNSVHQDALEDMRLSLLRRSAPSSAATTADGAAPSPAALRVNELIQAYRQWGYEKADIDPLRLEPRSSAELSAARQAIEDSLLDSEFAADHLYIGRNSCCLREIIEILERVYCGSIGVEIMQLPNTDERNWLLERMERNLGQETLSADEQRDLLGLLTAAEGLEKYLARTWPGTKRFGLDGAESLIVLLNELIQGAGARQVVEVMIGMAHRGRLNVLVNILGKNPRDLFDEFAGAAQVEGSGDVKYHQGFSSNVLTPGGEIHLALAFNPSHLEMVAPVVQGSVRARQDRRRDRERTRVLPIIIHGDASFAGQGVVMETLQMSRTRAHFTGGTVHIVINNQIGFTTSDARDARSTAYCTDVAKILNIPVLHVNADDPEAVLKVTRIALDYRQHFHRDIVIDLFGYRRYGHNEADDPTMTQPLMYKRIRRHPSVRSRYVRQLVERRVVSREQAGTMERDYRRRLGGGEQVLASLVREPDSRLFVDWHPYLNRRWDERCESGVPEERLRQLSEMINRVPDGMRLNRQVEKMLLQRQEMGRGERALDWGASETLAYASLLAEGHSVRLVGQDSVRGTFSHRHAALYDQDSGEPYLPLQNIADDQGKLMIHDSLLSELGSLAFEYGYAATAPDVLVIWEAQFGDFANGAQIIIDQFLSSGEAKWGRLCGMVLLLPHGYEGQGPEHSSARLERFLQLCAQDNMQVCVPSTPAQIFHLLRRQLLRPLRRPLIVMTPKSLLRQRDAVSALSELAEGDFITVRRDSEGPPPPQVRRLVLCSGKVYYDLYKERHARRADDVGLLRIEQLYPFPAIELGWEMLRYGNLQEVVWCQEEPRNQGAWYTTRHRISRSMRGVGLQLQLEYAGRESSAAPAAGHLALHMQQQADFLGEAISPQR